MNPHFSAVTLFCDSFREEVGGMTSLVGILPDNLAVSSFPITLPRLCIYTRMVVPSDEVPTIVDVVLQTPDGGEQISTRLEDETLAGALSNQTGDSAPIGHMYVVTATAPFTMGAVGRLLSIVRVDGTEIIAGSLNFTLQT